MRHGLLLGRDHTEIGAIAAESEGALAVALSRGGARKLYSHHDPNEDAASAPGDALPLLGGLPRLQEILENQVVDEVRKHFKEIVFTTIIPRNIKLSEAPGFGKPVIAYDADSRGAICYLNLAREIVHKK